MNKKGPSLFVQNSDLNHCIHKRQSLKYQLKEIKSGTKSEQKGTVLFYSFWRNGLWGFATFGDGRRMLQKVHWAVKMKIAAGGWVLK
ncbi:MAG: hypothetical protein IKQ89_04480, partial [Muribaculaceae bacterium]|nr:hypothetical protein [Muribaculaceae bacterium]